MKESTQPEKPVTSVYETATNAYGRIRALIQSAPTSNHTFSAAPGKARSVRFGEAVGSLGADIIGIREGALPVEEADLSENSVEAAGSDMELRSGCTGDMDRHGDGLLPEESSRLSAIAVPSEVLRDKRIVGLGGESKLDALIPESNQSSESQAGQSEAAWSSDQIQDSFAQASSGRPGEHHGIGIWDGWLAGLSQCCTDPASDISQLSEKDSSFLRGLSERGLLKQGNDDRHLLSIFGPTIDRSDDDVRVFYAVLLGYVGDCFRPRMNPAVKQGIASILSVLILGTETDVAESATARVVSSLFGRFKSQKTNTIGGPRTEQAIKDKRAEFFMRLLLWMNAGKPKVDTDNAWPWDPEQEYQALLALHDYCQNKLAEHGQKLPNGVFTQPVTEAIRKEVLHALRCRSETYIDLIISLLLPPDKMGEDAGALREFLRAISGQGGSYLTPLSIEEFYALTYVLYFRSRDCSWVGYGTVLARCLEILSVDFGRSEDRVLLDAFLRKGYQSKPGSIWGWNLTRDGENPEVSVIDKKIHNSFLSDAIKVAYQKACLSYSGGRSEQHKVMFRLVQAVAHRVTDKEDYLIPCAVSSPNVTGVEGSYSGSQLTVRRKRAKVREVNLDESSKRLDERSSVQLISASLEEQEGPAEIATPAVSSETTETTSVPVSSDLIAGTSVVDRNADSLDALDGESEMTVQVFDLPPIQLDICVRSRTDSPVLEGVEADSKSEMSFHDSAPALKRLQALDSTDFGVQARVSLHSMEKIMPGGDDILSSEQGRHGSMLVALSSYVSKSCEKVEVEVYATSLQLSSQDLLVHLGYEPPGWDTATVGKTFDPFFTGFELVINRIYAHLCAAEIAALNATGQRAQSVGGSGEVRARGVGEDKVAFMRRFTLALFSSYLEFVDPHTYVTKRPLSSELERCWGLLRASKERLQYNISQIKERRAAYLERQESFLNFVQGSVFSQPQFNHWMKRVEDCFIRDEPSFFEKIRRIFFRGFVYSQAGLKRLARDMLLASVHYSPERVALLQLDPAQPCQLGPERVRAYLSKLPWYIRLFRYGILIIPSKEAAHHHDRLVRHLLAEQALKQLVEFRSCWEHIQQDWKGVGAADTGVPAEKACFKPEGRRRLQTFAENWGKFVREIARSLPAWLGGATTATLTEPSPEELCTAKPNFEEFGDSFLDGLSKHAGYCTAAEWETRKEITRLDGLLARLAPASVLDVSELERQVGEFLAQGVPLCICGADPAAPKSNDTSPQVNALLVGEQFRLFSPPCTAQMGARVPAEEWSPIASPRMQVQAR